MLVRHARGAAVAAVLAMIAVAATAQGAVAYSALGGSAVGVGKTAATVAQQQASQPASSASHGGAGRISGGIAERGGKLPEVRNAAGEPLHVGDGACERRMARAASEGLRLPDGWTLHCVGQGLDWEGGTHWGVTCPYEECPEGEGPYVSISNPTYYVIAHELCHANFGNDESMADACAAEHGASLATSPYR